MPMCLARRYVAKAPIIFVLACFAAVAQGIELATPGPTAERPDPQGVPTPIEIGVYLIGIDDIDDVSQRFSIDFFVSLAWTDGRLALPPAERNGENRVFRLDEIWTPRLVIVNDRGIRPQLPRTVEVDDNGNVLYLQRLSGELAADFEFRDFPFDTQRLPLQVVSYYYRSGELALSIRPTDDTDDGVYRVAGWNLRVLGAETGDFRVPSVKYPRPRLTWWMQADRNSGYYLLTMALPMTLIVLMAWTVFWLPPDIVPSRIAISTASIFSLIALGFSIRLKLPPVSYMTRADLFVVGCTLLVFVALGTAVIGSRWASTDRMGRALALNRIARLGYLALFVIVAAIALFS